MNSSIVRFIRASVPAAALLFANLSRGNDAPNPWPAGVVDFAGRAAHNHAYLFGEENRATLDSLNRDLRDAREDFERARDEKARGAAAERGSVISDKLLGIVQACQQRIRVDLSGSSAAMTPDGPYTLPGDSGAFLFEVRAGGPGVSYSTATFDLDDPKGESSTVGVAVASSGTTYALVGLDHLPNGRNSFKIEFDRPDGAPVTFPLELAMPPPGRLKLTVLSDDTGKPAPAMVQLLWRTDGNVHKPSNGIEFAPQFDKQGRSTGARNANLPGPLGDAFWCVPGPFDMTLSPGKWRIGVRRGVEHEVVFEEVTIRSGETLERTYRPKRWTDMRRLGWWSGDDHVHCRILSDDDARNLLAWVEAEDVHVANIVKMGDIYRTFFEQRGFGPTHRVTDGEFVLVPGQECPRTHEQIGHVLALNITSMVRNPKRYFLYDEVFDAVHAQGGVTGYAHINSDLFYVHRDMAINMPRNKVDFAEILQFNKLGTDLYYEFLNLGCKLAASAGSDVPWGGTIGEVRTYVYLGNSGFSADAWFDGLRNGHTFTTSGPMIEFTVDDAVPGDEIRVSADRKLHVHARAWGDPQRSAPVTLEIVRHGEVIGTATSTDPQRPEATVDMIVDSGFGCWIAARARAGDGTSAHTTPVYVVREGYRFWKFDGLGDLIDRRLASLHEVEQLVADARRLQSEGKLGSDRYRQELVKQGDDLLERVAIARDLYAGLRQTADAERGAREAETHR